MILKMKYSFKLYILNVKFLLMLVMYEKFMGYCDVNNYRMINVESYF